MHLLVLDNFDSFTYMLVDYLRQTGARCTVIRNDQPVETFITQSFDGVVLSPGPGTPRQAGNLMEVIAHYANRLPILGVCLGQQALGAFFGATLGPGHLPMHGKVSAIRVDANDELFRGMPQTIRVTRYHSLVLQSLPPDLMSIAQTIPGETGDCTEIMAIRHRTRPIWGVQFHPEAVLTEYGLRLLQNWIDVVTCSRNKAAAPVAVAS